MGKRPPQYTMKKALNFLVLVSIRDLTEEKKPTDEAGHKIEESDPSVAKKIKAIRISLHEIENKLTENKKMWDNYHTHTSFSDKLSKALADFNIVQDDSKAIVRFNDGGWYRGVCFDSGLKQAAEKLADALEFDLAAPVEIKEPQYDLLPVEKKTIMTYEDFNTLANILNEDIYKVIGRTSVEQAAWTRKILGKYYK